MCDLKTESNFIRIKVLGLGSLGLKLIYLNYIEGSNESKLNNMQVKFQRNSNRGEFK